MNKLIIGAALLFLMACSNDKKESPTTTEPDSKVEEPISPATLPPATNTNGPKASVTIEGKEIHLGATMIVVKDKKKLHPGADYMALVTTYGGPDEEGLTLHFVFALKTGTYPVQTMGFSRKPAGNAQMFGNLMGGKLNIPNKMVTLTECKDLGDNNMGGHKWSISGTIDETELPGLKLLMKDESKNHPASLTLQKTSFSNLVFDDNWDEIKEQRLKNLEKK